MIEIRDITKAYQMGTNRLQVLNGVSLTIEDGDFVAIMGPSGSGKSTLMNILGLLDVPTSGSYLFNGREVSGMSEDELAVFRREQIGFIFQQFNLLPRMSAFENVFLPLLYSKKENESLAEKLLARVGLKTRMTHRPNELSGGQQQRVAIARSLINQPRMILADEPTGNLDSHSEREILATLKELNDQGITVVIVTHEENIGNKAKRLIRVLDGYIHSDERVEPLPAKPHFEPKVKGSDTSFYLKEVIAHFDQGFRTLAANKVRTCLSMLGILIGVAAVVAMLALGRGAQKAIEDQLSSLGSNLLVLRPGSLNVGGVSQGAGGTSRLTLEDATALKTQISSLSEVAPSVNGHGQITYLNKNWATQVLGATSSYSKMHASEPEVGRFFSEAENQRRARVVVIGMTVVKNLFGDKISPIGEMVKINRVNFQVVGILPEKGATGWRDQDDIIIIPVLTAMHRLLGKTYVDNIELEVDKPENIDNDEDLAKQIIYKRHRIPLSQPDAFQIHNMADVQAALSQSSQTMSLLLASIAAISLIVGGIGIMNIMLVSVTERTKEIGLRKAVGARKNDILMQFLAESVVVSVVGGVMGIILGWLTTVLLSQFAGWATSVSIQSIMLAFFCSSFIGVIFGVYPAKKASQLNPIDALRYD